MRSDPGVSTKPNRSSEISSKPEEERTSDALLASGTRAGNIARARRLLDVPVIQPEAGDDSGAEADEPKPLLHPCPCCGGRMIVVETFQRGGAPRYHPAASTAEIRIDTS